MKYRVNRLFLAVSLMAGLACPPAIAADTDFSSAVISVAGNDRLVQKSAEILADEIYKRSGKTLKISGLDSDGVQKIIIGCEADIAGRWTSLAGTLAGMEDTRDEGYKLLARPSDGLIVVAGHDPRGVLYGTGKLLRMSDISTAGFNVPDTLLVSSPVYALRGHELLPSPRAKSPDEQWAKDNFDQYVRELALYGMNSIEMLRSVPPAYVDIAKSYGMDVWVVTYDNGPDFVTPKGLQTELKFRENIFKKFPVIDNWCIKSGDPGDLPLDLFFDFSEKEVALLKKYHPEAEVWLSPQHFVDAPMSYFEEFCRKANAAEWVDGVVFGPWCRMTIQQLREKIRPELPIRNFPDITHIYSCQYPAYSIDLPMAMTLGRICINPAPKAQKYIHNLFDEYTCGSLTYSEGTNDDFNKFLWLMLDWDPETGAKEAAEDYARFFFGKDIAPAFAEGLFAIERNLVGPLEENAGVEATLEHWQALEKSAGDSLMSNPRFLMPLLRAYYDAYIYRRWKYELSLENQAYSVLKEAGQKGSSRVIAQAKKILAMAETKPVSKDLRSRCLDLYDKVYNDKGKWTMEYQHCPLIDQIDISLNDREWIEMKLDEIFLLPTDEKRAEAITSLLARTDPGESGLYFDLGDHSSENVTGIDGAWEYDPSHLVTPHCGLGAKMKKGFVMTHNGFDGKPVPRAWLTQAGIYYDQPLELTFEGLDPDVEYRVKIVYVGEANKYKSHVRLDADGQVIHFPFTLDGDVIREYDLPHDITRDGKVTLTWRCNEGERGVHVAEIKKKKK